ncbi:MAG TPA: SCO family protein [Gemmatimonadaceae bacterium]|nr:SCO family protein [Gemmatimonadaceae bacterium]
MRQVARAVGAASCLLVLGACRDEYKFYGIPLNPMVSAPAVGLTRSDGSRFDLESQKGKASLVFFGYTHCPDICPTTLSDWTRVKTALGDDASKVNFVFVTIDPQNDTPAVMQQYLTNFDTTFVGLTGAPAAIDSISKAFGVSAFQDGTLESGHAAMAHPSRVYLVDPQGRIRFVYPPGLKAEEIAEDVKHVL